MKKYSIEFLGTMFLVLVVALSEGNPVAIGGVLAALVYMGGYISGGHYNPAVTLAVWKAGKLPKSELFSYILSQVGGVIIGTVLYGFIKGSTFVAAPPSGAALVPMFLVETVFTFALASVVLHTAVASKAKNSQYYGLAIGAVLMAGIFASASISGAVFNPAIVVGSSIVNLTNSAVSFSHVVTYLVAQLIGGLLAGIMFKLTSE